MVFPDNFESKIGFDKIRNLIKSECIASPAKCIVDDIAFSTDINYIRKSLSLAGEMMSICMLKDNYPDYVWAIVINPLTSIIEVFKLGFLGTGTFEWAYFIYSLVFTIIILTLGMLTFNKVQRSFMDVI